MRIQSRQHFEFVMERLKTIAKTERRLPQQVFQGSLNHTSCFEFELFSGPEFWGLVQNIARTYADTRIVVAVTDPDPEGYFYKEFGEFGAVELDVDLDADGYFNSLAAFPDGWPVDSILQNSECLVWFGEGSRRLIWGERSVGIAILGTQDLLDVQSLARSAGAQVFTAPDALSNLISLNFRDERISEEWAREFLKNYQEQPSVATQ